MIGIRNLKEESYHLRKAGAAAVTNDVDQISVPYDAYIVAIFAVFGVMGTDGTGAPTQDVIVDIKKNGTSIFSGAGKINWAHAGQLGTANTPTKASSYGAMTTNPPTLSKGDFLRLDITQILNGTSPTQPTDLSVFVVLQRKAGGSTPPVSVLTGQVDVND